MSRIQQLGRDAPCCITLFLTGGQGPFCSSKPPTSLGIAKVAAEPAKLFQTSTKLFCRHTSVSTERHTDTRQVPWDWAQFVTRQIGPGWTVLHGKFSRKLKKWTCQGNAENPEPPLGDV